MTPLSPTMYYWKSILDCLISFITKINMTDYGLQKLLRVSEFDPSFETLDSTFNHPLRIILTVYHIPESYVPPLKLSCMFRNRPKLQKANSHLAAIKTELFNIKYVTKVVTNWRNIILSLSTSFYRNTKHEKHILSILFCSGSNDNSRESWLKLNCFPNNLGTSHTESLLELIRWQIQTKMSHT